MSNRTNEEKTGRIIVGGTAVAMMEERLVTAGLLDRMFLRLDQDVNGVWRVIGLSKRRALDSDKVLEPLGGSNEPYEEQGYRVLTYGTCVPKGEDISEELVELAKVAFQNWRSSQPMKYETAGPRQYESHRLLENLANGTVGMGSFQYGAGGVWMLYELLQCEENTDKAIDLMLFCKPGDIGKIWFSWSNDETPLTRVPFELKGDGNDWKNLLELCDYLERLIQQAADRRLIPAYEEWRKEHGLKPEGDKRRLGYRCGTGDRMYMSGLAKDGFRLTAMGLDAGAVILGAVCEAAELNEMDLAECGVPENMGDRELYQKYLGDAWCNENMEAFAGVMARANNQ